LHRLQSKWQSACSERLRINYPLIKQQRTQDEMSR
jgi:hypothetical protein